MMGEKSREFLRLAKEKETELVSFLQDLVRIPSVNGRDSEAAVAQRIVQEANKLGLKSEIIAANAERPNALVEWGNGPKGFAIIGHIDTVAEGDHWTHPPFDAVIENGMMYGRGTADNKAGIACGVYTLALLRDLGIFDPAEVRLIAAGVADEESGASSPWGVRSLIDGGHLPVNGAIYAYSSDIVCIGHRGLIRLAVEAQGRAIHTGSAEWGRGEGGANAVTALAAVLLELENLRVPTPGHPLFDNLGCTITPGTLIRGGDFESMVPAFAQAIVDIRLLPGQSDAEILQAVDEILARETERRPGISFHYSVKNNLPGAFIQPNHPLAEISQRYAREYTGAEWPIAIAGPANEGYMLIEAGIPTLCGFGPTGGGAHAPDEWVDVESLATTVAMFGRIIVDYLHN